MPERDGKNLPDKPKESLVQGLISFAASIEGKNVSDEQLEEMVDRAYLEQGITAGDYEEDISDIISSLEDLVGDLFRVEGASKFLVDDDGNDAARIKIRTDLADIDTDKIFKGGKKQEAHKYIIRKALSKITKGEMKAKDFIETIMKSRPLLTYNPEASVKENVQRNITSVFQAVRSNLRLVGLTFLLSAPVWGSAGVGLTYYFMNNSTPVVKQINGSDTNYVSMLETLAQGQEPYPVDLGEGHVTSVNNGASESGDSETPSSGSGSANAGTDTDKSGKTSTDQGATDATHGKTGQTGGGEEKQKPQGGTRSSDKAAELAEMLSEGRAPTEVVDQSEKSQPIIEAGKDTKMYAKAYDLSKDGAGYVLDLSDTHPKSFLPIAEYLVTEANWSANWKAIFSKIDQFDSGGLVISPFQKGTTIPDGDVVIEKSGDLEQIRIKKYVGSGQNEIIINKEPFAVLFVKPDGSVNYLRGVHKYFVDEANK